MNGKLVALAASASLGLVGAGSAIGYAARTVTVPRGALAVFAPAKAGAMPWSCRHYGTRIECSNGDAFPYVELTSTRGGVTVKVHTLNDPQGGHLVRVYADGLPVYVFTAF